MPISANHWNSKWLNLLNLKNLIWKTKVLPITEFGSFPKAQIHGGPCGIENLQKLHWLVKYFGIIGKDDSFGFGSSKLKTWIVPWSDDTTNIVEEWLKLMQ